MDTIVGTRLGAYLVEKRLGQGGMATIFLAVQPSTGRKVAIKTLPKSQLSDPKAVARFEREARVLASLQHPHILPLIDYGEAGEYKFLVVPYLAHGDLEDRLQRVLGPLDQAESRRLLTQLAEALEYAHSQGVIHRDLKPGNVLLDGQGNSMLADFGIAHQEGSDRLTGVGFTVGTPEYMAPEQVNGQPEARSDLYALGVLAFRLLTGALPFKGANATATLLLQRDTPAPDARSVHPGVSAEVAAFLGRALAKDLRERYQSGAQFAQAVRAVLPETSPSAQDSTQHISRRDLPVFTSASTDGSTQPHLPAPPPAAPVSPVGGRQQTTAERDLPAFAAPTTPSSPNTREPPDLIALASQALRGSSSQSAHVTSQRPVVRTPPARATPVPPSVAAAKPKPWVWILITLLLLGVLAGAWLWWQHTAQPAAAAQIQLPSVESAVRPDRLTGTKATPAQPDFKLFDDFSTSLDPERWQSVGGLLAKVGSGRLRAQVVRPGQWLRARALPPYAGASVMVQLERVSGEATEAAAGLTLSRGNWWISCYVFRYASSGQLEARCLENDVIVFEGQVLPDEPHELAIVAADNGAYQFLLDGMITAHLKPRRSPPADPLMLVLTLWTPAEGAKVAAEFDDVRLAQTR